MNIGRREAAERLRELRDERNTLKVEVERLRTELDLTQWAHALQEQRADRAEARVAALTAENNALRVRLSLATGRPVSSLGGTETP